MVVPNKNNRTWLAATGICTLLSLALVWTALAANEPGLAISKTGANQYSVGITNGTNTAYYELYHTPVVGDSAYPWMLLVMGTQGQTNFSVDGGPTMTGFFFVGVGNDWDGDGVQNYRDANPNSAIFGQLTITVDSPTNGAVFQ